MGFAMSLRGLITLYACFAAIATVANLLTQRIVLAWDTTTTGFAVAVFCGTLVGLVIKYILDKRWIFRDTETGVKAHGRKFTLYTTMGVVTTAIFWSTETAFWLIWGTELMREAGAVLGLLVGYIVKYRLDRRFVFTDVRLGGSS
jgi:putative flippase GtrA